MGLFFFLRFLGLHRKFMRKKMYLDSILIKNSLFILFYFSKYINNDISFINIVECGSKIYKSYLTHHKNEGEIKTIKNKIQKLIS